jgi:hypothetical protein
MNDQEDYFETFSNLIDSMFEKTFAKKKKPMEPMTITEVPSEELSSKESYSSPDEYKERTGKRFRMTKDQKSRGLSRLEAFRETWGGSN